MSQISKLQQYFDRLVVFEYQDPFPDVNFDVKCINTILLRKKEISF